MSSTNVVTINGQRVFLGNLLGQGAMADVFKVQVDGQQMAAKIYRYDGDPGKELMRPIRAEKIPKMVSMQISPQIFPPRSVIYSQSGEFLGFTMDLIPEGFKPLAELYSNSFWARNLINPQKALVVMKALQQLVIGIHSSGLVMCDFNPGNAEFSLSRLDQVIGCDIDSYQIPGYNGREAHFAYCAPRLYGKDLATGTVPFLPEDDWWSYYVHFMTALTRGGHPFRGKGKWWAQNAKNMEVPDRVLSGISIFHPEVEPLGGALPIEILTDEALSLLQKSLVEARRAPGPLPDWVFEMQFTRCSACGTEHARMSCPVCSKQVFLPQALPSVAVVFVPDVYKTQLAITTASYEDGVTTLVLRGPDRYIVEKIDLAGKVISSSNLELALTPGNDYLVKVGKDIIGVADSESLSVFDHSGKLVDKTTTGQFLKTQMFSAGNKLYRGAGGSVMVRETIGGMKVYKPVLHNIPLGSTWYETTDQGLVAMIYANGLYDWILLQGNNRREIKVQPIPRGCYTVSQRAIADDKSVVILRVVEDRSGHRSTLVDRYAIFNSAVTSEIYDGVIRRPAYMNNALVFGTDEGLAILREGQSAQIRPGTEQAVSEGDRIFLADPKTILVVKPNSVGILKAQ